MTLKLFRNVEGHVKGDSENPAKPGAGLGERFYSFRYVEFGSLRKNAKPESSLAKARWITRALLSKLKAPRLHTAGRDEEGFRLG